MIYCQFNRWQHVAVIYKGEYQSYWLIDGDELAFDFIYWAFVFCLWAIFILQTSFVFIRAYKKT